jgi:nucleoside-diphosphate-sugar epimerase
LTTLGADVHAVSRRAGHGPESQAWHVADLTDPRACVELVETVATDVVFRLASAVTGARNPDLVVPAMLPNQCAAENLLTALAKSARPIDLAQRCDPRPAAELLDWRDSTPLESGLRKTVAWYSENLLTAPAGRPIDERAR